MADVLHVSNGDATDLPGTGLAPDPLYWRDVLHEGPVPDVPPDELRRIRAEFLTAAGADDRGEAGDLFAERDRILDAHPGEFVLWFEADLYDQLQVVEILARLAERGVRPAAVTLICIGEHLAVARFGGLGELTAGQLRALPDTDVPVRLTPAAFELAGRAWAAFRAPEPAGLAGIARARSRELRFLGEAFDRLGREYPSTRDGLALTERRILAAVAAGAPDAGTAFVRAAARETRPFLGDTTAFARMAGLAAGPDPLLAAGLPIGGATPVRLTATGERVLAGTADHVARNGIDRWIGGVHLRGTDVRWRWDEGIEEVVAVS
jgi:hypothetical protein